MPPSLAKDCPSPSRDQFSQSAPFNMRVVERECAPRLCPFGRPRRRAVLLLEGEEPLSDKLVELVRRLARDWGWDVRRPNSFKQREARR